MIPKDIGDVKTGDKVAVDVRDNSGNILLTKGAELTTQMIGLLITRGVKMLIVECNDPEEIKKYEKIREEQIKKTHKIFAGKEKYPELMAVRDAIIKYQSENFVLL